MDRVNEEDINRCKELIKEAHSCWIGISNQKAIENLLKGYKDQEEQINYLRRSCERKEETIIEAQHECIECQKLDNSIPKSKIKEKIKEYEKQRIKMEKDDYGIGFTLGNKWSDLKAKIQVLQELLESEE